MTQTALAGDSTLSLTAYFECTGEQRMLCQLLSRLGRLRLPVHTGSLHSVLPDARSFVVTSAPKESPLQGMDPSNTQPGSESERKLNLSWGKAGLRMKASRLGGVAAPQQSEQQCASPKRSISALYAYRMSNTSRM